MNVCVEFTNNIRLRLPYVIPRSAAKRKLSININLIMQHWLAGALPTPPHI